MSSAPITKLAQANALQDSMKMSRPFSIFASISVQIEAIMRSGVRALLLLPAGEVGIDPVYESRRGGLGTKDTVKIRRGLGRANLL